MAKNTIFLKFSKHQHMTNMTYSSAQSSQSTQTIKTRCLNNNSKPLETNYRSVYFSNTLILNYYSYCAIISPCCLQQFIFLIFT